VRWRRRKEIIKKTMSKVANRKVNTDKKKYKNFKTFIRTSIFITSLSFPTNKTNYQFILLKVLVSICLILFHLTVKACYLLQLASANHRSLTRLQEQTAYFSISLAFLVLFHLPPTFCSSLTFFFSFP